jgi:hypothetical protein
MQARQSAAPGTRSSTHTSLGAKTGQRHSREYSAGAVEPAKLAAQPTPFRARDPCRARLLTSATGTIPD